MNSDRPRLILLPGLDGTGELFEPLADELSGEFLTEAVTYPTEGEQTYSSLLLHVVKALPVRDPFFLLGWSFSGPLALMVAADPPANLRGVILCASFDANPHPLLAWLAPVATPALFRLFPFFSQAKTMLGGYSNPDLRRRLASAHAAAGPVALAARTRQVLRLRKTGLASRCAVPLLYLAGTGDFVVPRRNARAIQRAASCAEVVSIAGPHLLLLTNPGAAARSITAFCRHAA